MFLNCNAYYTAMLEAFKRHTNTAGASAPVQGGVLCDVGPHVLDAGQALEEGQDVDQLPVAHVIVPGHNGDAVVDLVPKHLNRRTPGQPHDLPEQLQVTNFCCLRSWLQCTAVPLSIRLNGIIWVS